MQTANELINFENMGEKVFQDVDGMILKTNLWCKTPK